MAAKNFLDITSMETPGLILLNSYNIVSQHSQLLVIPELNLQSFFPKFI